MPCLTFRLSSGSCSGLYHLRVSLSSPASFWLSVATLCSPNRRRLFLLPELLGVGNPGGAIGLLPLPLSLGRLDCPDSRFSLSEENEAAGDGDNVLCNAGLDAVGVRSR